MKKYVLPIALGIASFILLGLGLHFYSDHLLVDAIRQDLIKRQTQAPKPQPTQETK